MSFGNFLFMLGIGFVLFGLVWRVQLSRSGERLHRRVFFADPLLFVFIGVIVAIISLYITGEL